MNGGHELACGQVKDHTWGEVMLANTFAELEILVKHSPQRQWNRLQMSHSQQSSSQMDRGQHTFKMICEVGGLSLES